MEKVKKEYIKKTKLFFSIIKEKLWLEYMAEQGYILTNITMGMRFTFGVEEPKRLVYEIDRFDLPKSPTLKEIKYKDEFLELAQEMGWSVVTHDEDMNYYFVKEYTEDGINELYDSEEMRKIRALKYKKRFDTLANFILVFGIFFGLFAFIAAWNDLSYLKFSLGYLLFTSSYAVLAQAIARKYYRELMLSASEWKTLYSNKNEDRKVVRKWFFFSKKLSNYLSKQSEKGWHIVRMTRFKYYFSKGKPEYRSYLIDTKKSVNMRIRANKGKVSRDRKDINNLCNDWQLQSVKDAKGNGWDFVCATGNLHILYVGKCHEGEYPTPLKVRNLCLYPWTKFYTICFIIGFIIGVCISFVLRN